VTVEADWSQAGFWYAAKGLGNPVELTGLDPDSAQGDKVAAENYEKLCRPGEVTLDVSQCPDLVPALAAHAALRGAGAVTYMVNAARLRIKESDRLSAVREELSKLGAQVEEGPDSLTLTGVDSLTRGQVDSHNDHRIAMMLAVAATRADEPVTLTGAQAVNKSYPNFWEDYQKLGGKIQMIP
jgi:3-phosphoshikimate 1-carboxyvinyltransferase